MGFAVLHNREYPNAEDRKTNKTGSRKGKSIIATSTYRKNAVAERKTGRSDINITKMKSNEPDKMELQDSCVNEKISSKRRSLWMRIMSLEI